MAKFAVIWTIVVVACIGLAHAAPLEKHGNHGLGFRESMADKFIEFVKQDQQLSSLLGEDSNINADVARSRRDVDDVESIDETTLSAGSEGFFDRATKFVMEVLQRFLRWINTDD